MVGAEAPLTTFMGLLGAWGAACIIISAQTEDWNHKSAAHAGGTASVLMASWRKSSVWLGVPQTILSLSIVLFLSPPPKKSVWYETLVKRLEPLTVSQCPYCVDQSQIVLKRNSSGDRNWHAGQCKGSAIILSESQFNQLFCGWQLVMFTSLMMLLEVCNNF